MRSGGHAERDRGVDVAVAEQVDERVDALGRDGPDAVDQAVAVRHRDRRRARAATRGWCSDAIPTTRGARAAGQLHGQHADAARRGRDHHGLARARVDRADRGPGRGPDDVQRPGLLPRQLGGLRDDVPDRHGHVLGLARARRRSTRTPRRRPRRRPPRAERAHRAREVAALARRERRGPALGVAALADVGLARVDARRRHLDQHLVGPRLRHRHLGDAQDVDPTVLVVLHSSHARPNPGRRSDMPVRGGCRPAAWRARRSPGRAAPPRRTRSPTIVRDAARRPRPGARTR